MIPFYVLSVLLIALPSTTTDAVPIVIANTPSSQTSNRTPTTVIANTPSSQTSTPTTVIANIPSSQTSTRTPTTVIANTPSSQTSTPTVTLSPSPSPPPMLSPSLPPPSLTNRSGSSKPSSMIIIVGTLGSVAFCSLVVGCFFRKRLRTVKERYHSKRQKKKVGNDMKKTVESLQFRLGTIETATNKFSDDNKLGEGGFGAVFKGTLGNGHEIAVKRLSKSSTQGVQEFQNEVVLVAKLHHRNLVRLLGFCLEGEETLLVYEYVPNKSLDKFLFGL
ncbi:hypothetical protein ACFX2K_034444 [Malus domestica]